MSIHRFIESSAVKRRLLALLADRDLQRRDDVGQEQDVRRGRLRRQLGLEGLEDVEVGPQRLADVDVALVAARPEERLAARDVLDVVRVDAAVVHDLELRVAEVITDRTDDARAGEER